MIRFLLAVLLVGSSAMAFECPATPQEMLVLDLKSGWWDGDGSPFHKEILRKVTKDCPNVRAEFHLVFANHVSTVLFENGNSEEKPNVAPLQLAQAPQAYSQVWILSGSERDSADIKIDSPQAKVIEELLAVNPGGLYVGASMGFIDLGNHFLNSLGVGAQFATDVKDLDFAASTVRAIKTRIVQLAPSPVFKDVKALPETLSLTTGDVQSDWLAPTGGNLTPIAHRGDWKVAIAKGKVKGRNVVLDAGVHRFYSVFTDEGDQTYNYLIGIIRELGK